MPKQITASRLQEIGNLPDDALVRVKEGAALEVISLSTAWRRVRSGVWPVAQIGGMTRVKLGALRKVHDMACGDGGDNE